MQGSVPQTVVDAGEALDLAIEREKAAEKIAAVLAHSDSQPPGFEIHIGALRLQSPKRRRFRKVIAALDLAKTRREAAQTAYREAVWAARDVDAQQRVLMAESRKQLAGTDAGQNQAH